MHKTATRKQSLAARYVMCSLVAKIIIVFQGRSQRQIMIAVMSTA